MKYTKSKANKSGRPRSIEPNPEIYRETMVMMMRYGNNVDQIARDLGMQETTLVNFIKKEGIDKDLSRRSWKWKSTGPRRNRIVSKGSYIGKGRDRL